MVSNTEKGERNEREAANILARVYGKGNVEKVRTYGRNDPFNIVDVIAVDSNKPVLFVQVKTNRFTQKDKKKYKSRVKRLPSDHSAFEVWVRVDYTGWKMFEWDFDEKKFVKYLEMDTCNHEETVEAFRESVGFYE